MCAEKENCKYCGDQVYLRAGCCSKKSCLEARSMASNRGQHSDMADGFHRSQFEYFYSLVRPKAKKVRKPCLRCRKPLVCVDFANRICADCHTVNEKVGSHAVYGI